MALDASAFAPPLESRRGLSRLTEPSGGGTSTDLGAVGGPTPASEGGRAFGSGSPFSGYSGTLGNLGVAGANLALGLPSIMAFGGALGIPMGVARGAEALSNYSFNVPSNEANSPFSSALADLQSGFQNFFGTTPTTESLNNALGINQSVGTNPALAAQRAGERGDLSPRGVEDLSPSPDAPSAPDAAGPSAGTATGDSSTGGDPGGSTYRRGGLVPNLHPGGGDDEPAMLKGGEFVLRAPAVKRIGLGRLMKENQ